MTEVYIKHCSDCNEYADKTLFKKFYQYYLEEKMVDVTFVCFQHRHVKAHRLILSSMSTIFNHLFRVDNGRDIYITIFDTSYELLREFLELLYKGSVQIKEDSLSGLMKLIKFFHIEGINETELLDSSQLNKQNTCPKNVENDQLNQNSSATYRYAENEDYYNEESTRIDVRDLEKPKRLKVYLVNLGSSIQKGLQNDSLDETNYEVPDIIEGSLDSSTDTEPFNDFLERLGITENINSEKNLHDYTLAQSNELDTNKSFNSQIFETTANLYESNTEVHFSEENRLVNNEPLSSEKKIEEPLRCLSVKIPRYETVNSRESQEDSDSCSSDEIICNPLKINDTVAPDNFLKFLQLMRR